MWGKEHSIEDMTRLEKVDTPYGTYFAFSADLITADLREFGAHNRNELAMIRDLVKPGDLVLDIGANIGTSAIPIALKIGNAGAVVAFEGDHDIYDVLTKNVALNDLAGVIKPIHAIVTNRPGHYSVRTKGGNRGATSFELQKDEPPDARHSSPTVAVDRWYDASTLRGRQVDLIKIDVEGMDGIALLTCERIIRRDLPLIYIEINPNRLRRYWQSDEDIEATLRGYGYQFFRNIGPRNSNNDSYKAVELHRLSAGGPFFDLLAVHPSKERYPREWKGQMYGRMWSSRRMLAVWLKRVLR